MTKNELKYFSNLKKKEFRFEENIFLIEGSHLVDECLSSKYYSKNIQKIFVRKDFRENILGKLLKLGILPVVLSENEIDKLSETKTSQGIIAVVKKLKERDINDSKYQLAVALDSINDPGNLGTILRTCWWYGVDKVYISSNSVDLFNPKAIRGTQGAIFNLDINTNIDLKSFLPELKNWNIFATDLKSRKYLDEISFDVNSRYLIIFGNEANGISPELLSLPQLEKIRIRGYSECESLNVGVSAGIVLSKIKYQK